MKVKRQNFFMVFYVFLIGITIFSPEQFGTTLKYGIVPLVGMFFCAHINKTMNSIRIIAILFLSTICISTFSSRCPGVAKLSGNFRSVCLLIVFFIILSTVKLNYIELEKIKTWYSVFSLFCGLWVVGTALLNGLGNINRYKFEFIWGLKDVNYLLAFMLPGCYIAFRRVTFEKSKKKFLNILCIFSALASVLILETRASFLTIIIVLGISAFEYFYEEGMSIQKIIILILTIISAALIIAWIISMPAFSRLTSIDSYEDNIRLIIWKEALKGFNANPLFGSGLGSASYYAVIATNYQSHNNYLDILCDFGIVGLLLFLSIIILLLRVPKKYKLYMVSYMISFLLPLAFINGFQTLVFWVPMLLLVHENVILRSLKEENI